MTPDRALEILDPWAADSRKRGNVRRAEKLEGIAACIREMQQRSVDSKVAVIEQTGMQPGITHNPPVYVGEPSTSWRDKARQLGIPMYQRKRADVEADIAAKEAESA